MSKRDCENCIHHVNGSCEAWECNFEDLAVLKIYGIEKYKYLEGKQIVAFDRFDQAFIPVGVVEINGKYYDALHYNFKPAEFLEGWPVGEHVKEFPREIKHFMYVPKELEE